MIWLERRCVRHQPSGRLSRWLQRFGYRAEPSDVEIIVWRYARERATSAVASPGEREPVIDPDNLSRIEQWLDDGIRSPRSADASTAGTRTSPTRS